jgi:hypothetical protein
MRLPFKQMFERLLGRPVEQAFDFQQFCANGGWQNDPGAPWP